MDASAVVNLVFNAVLAITAVYSARAALVSAKLAEKANADNARGERVRLIREVSLLANRTLATATRCDGLANDLKQAHRSSAVHEGTLGGSRHKMYEQSIAQTQSAVGEKQVLALQLLELPLDNFTDDELADRIRKLEGDLTHLERVREKFLLDLANVQADARRVQTMIRG